MTYLISFLFSLGQLGRISLLDQEVNFYLYEVFLGLVLLWFISKYKTKPLKEAFIKFKSVFTFFGFLSLSYLLNLFSYDQQTNIVALLYFLRLLFYFIFFFYLRWYLVRKKVSLNKIQFAALIFITLTAFLALAQYFFYPDLRNLYYLGWDPHLYRVFGTFFDTSISAAIYGIILLYLVFKFKKLKLSRAVKVGAIAVYSLMGLFTYSRGFYLAMLSTLIIYLFFLKKYLLILVLLVVFAVSLPLLPKKSGEGVNLLRTFSVEARLEDNAKAISIWQERPLFGIGYNRIRAEKGKLEVINVKDSDFVHSAASFSSSFLIILVTGGLLSLAAFIFMLFRLSQISVFSKYLLVFTSIFSLWDNVLLHPFILFLLLALVSTEKEEL